MLLKTGIFEVVVVARATPPSEGLHPNQGKWHCPWCEDNTCVLGWGIGMHKVMVWAKAADHHGASGIEFSSATRVEKGPTKVS
jgi:hypothetical protein